MNNQVEQLFINSRLPFNRMVSHSKSDYRQKYPNHLVVFNASVIDKDGNHLWRGDLDVDLDSSKLEEVALNLKQQIFVVKEYDVVWADLKGKQLVAKHVWKSSNEEKEKSFFQKIREMLNL